MDKANWNDTINKLSSIKAGDLFIDTSFETAHFVPLNWSVLKSASLALTETGF